MISKYFVLRLQLVWVLKLYLKHWPDDKLSWVNRNFLKIKAKFFKRNKNKIFIIETLATINGHVMALLTTLNGDVRCGGLIPPW